MALEWPKMIQSGPKMTPNGPKFAQMAQKWRLDLRTFSAIFFDWKSGSAKIFAFRMYGENCDRNVTIMTEMWQLRQKCENCDRNVIIVTGKMKLWKFMGCLWSGKFVDFVGWNIIIGGQQSLWKCHNLGFWYFQMKKCKCCFQMEYFCKMLSFWSGLVLYLCVGGNICQKKETEREVDQTWENLDKKNYERAAFNCWIRGIADSQNTEDLFGKRVEREQMKRERDQTWIKTNHKTDWLDFFEVKWILLDKVFQHTPGNFLNAIFGLF